MKIKIRGTIIPDDYVDVYEFLGMTYTAPKSIVLPETKEDVEVEINSGGGDVYSGSEIYTRLKNYPGKVTVFITGLAASMASVIAMAGNNVKISPTSQIMIHNVSSSAWGDKNTMAHESRLLHGYDRTIANAYRLKTGLSEDELLRLMNEETWLTPQEALKYGFVDEILFDDDEAPMLSASAAPMLDAEKVKEIRGMLNMKKDNKMLNAEEEEEEQGEEETKEETEEEESEEESEEEEETQEEDAKDETAGATVEAEAVKSAYVNPQKRLEDKVLENDGKVHTFKNEASAETLKPMGGMNMKKTYKDAFLKFIRGNQMSAEDLGLIAQNNKEFTDEFTHNTDNTSIVIPETTQAAIWSRALEGYGVLQDITRLHTPGVLKMVKHKSIDEGDAKWYVEGTKTEDEKNTFDGFELTGHELSKAVTVSWKLRAMAMDDFENFLIREIGDRMSVALGTAVTQGTGTKEPMGIVTALKGAKKQTLATKDMNLTYDEMTKAISLVHSSYTNGAAIYANPKTLWTTLANVVDKNGQPFFTVTQNDNGVGNIFGFPVKSDASLKVGEILIGNPSKGYVFNVIEEMSMTTEGHAKDHETDYVAYMIADGNVLDEQAFALINVTGAGEPVV